MESHSKPGFLDEPEPGFSFALSGILVLTSAAMLAWECAQWIRVDPGHAPGNSIRPVIHVGVLVILSLVCLIRSWEARAQGREQGNGTSNGQIAVGLLILIGTAAYGGEALFEEEPDWILLCLTLPGLIVAACIIRNGLRLRRAAKTTGTPRG